MRGGAIPVLAWGTLIVVLLALNWVWTGDAIQIGTFGYAALSILGFGAALVIRSRPALRPGPPGEEPEPEVLPDSSLGAVLAAIGVASILFGLVWANFLVLFGAALGIGALGRVAAERRAERRSRRQAMAIGVGEERRA